MSAGSFYHQFDNKRDLLLQLLHDRVHSRRAGAAGELFRDGHTSFEEALRAGVEALLDEMDATPDTFVIQYRERENPDPAVRSAIVQGWSVWEDVTRRLLSRWYDPDAPGLTEAGQVLVFFVTGMLHEYLRVEPASRPVWRDELFDRSIRFARCGVDGLLSAPPLRDRP